MVLTGVRYVHSSRQRRLTGASKIPRNRDLGMVAVPGVVLPFANGRPMESVVESSTKSFRRVERGLVVCDW